MQFELTVEEAQEVRSVIEERLGELREEIYHADVSAFHDDLKARRVRLQGILAKLQTS